MKSKTTEALAEELAEGSRLLNHKISNLVSLRKEVADKETAASLKRKTTVEPAEQTRKFLESFSADRGSIL
jgi:hypothetical protein